LRLRNGDGSPVNGGADQISGVPAVAAIGQGGLLDVAVDPAFTSNRRIYISYSERDGSNPDLNGTAVSPLLEGEVAPEARVRGYALSG